jgi:hypothetical protein
MVVSHRRLGDCGYDITFLRGDNTAPLNDIIIHYAIDDSVYKLEIPVDTGSTSMPKSDSSCTIHWIPPEGFVGPYDVSGVTEMKDFVLEGGTVEQHTIADGICTPASTRGDPHMRSFDGHGYSFQGSCWYMLAKHCTDDPDFEITAEFAPRKSSGLDIRTRAVRLNVTVGDERISMDSENTVLINDRPIWAAKLSGRPKNAEIMNDEDQVSIKIPGYDLDILWHGRKHAFSAAVTHPDYNGNVCGLLGNADGDPLNDFQKSNGLQTRNIEEFGESWKLLDKECDY